jgi:hypothetical protein
MRFEAARLCASIPVPLTEQNVPRIELNPIVSSYFSEACTIQQHRFSESLRRNRRTAIATVAALIIVALVTGFYLLHLGNSPTQEPADETTPPASVPFDYHLDVFPTNGTLLQGNTVQTNVALTYVQGAPENVKLSASGLPQGIDYSFSALEGSPTEDSVFNSTLVIHVSESAPTNSYSITVTAVADNGETHNSSYTLSVIVLNSVVKVSGTIDGGVGIVPTQITFDQLSITGAHVQTFTASVQSGHYIIFLPDKQFYYVNVVWEGSDGVSGTHYFIMPCGVNAEGAASIIIPFSWTDYNR